MEPGNLTTKRLATVKMTAELYKGIFTESGLRWLIFNEYQNGFHKCLCRPTRGKVLINLNAFEEWLSQEHPAKPNLKRAS